MSKRIAVVAVLFSLWGVLFSQKMTVKDSDSNVLMEVIDEGTVGSIYLSQGPTPSTITDKLYNVSGILYWNGNPLASGSTAWSLTGNSGTTPGTHFVGTTDNQALELKVNGGRVLRLEPCSASPNIIGGYSGNSVTAGAVGAVIGGGGQSGSNNLVTDNYGTVSGGMNNRAGDNAGTNGDMQFASVGGGNNNKASGAGATVAGGAYSIANGYASAIGGGWTNKAMGGYSSIPGGNDNAARGFISYAAGNKAKANHDGSFVWADNQSDSVSSTGTNQFIVRAQGGVGINTNNPGTDLEVNGQVKITGGTPGSGKVLTSDSDGLAAWETPSSSGGGWTDGDAVVYTTVSTDNVGIGTTSPEFKLSLDNDGGILAKGSWSYGTELSNLGAGTRLIWYPMKAAFRAGTVDGSQWDHSSIGNYSSALGSNTTASGFYSVAMGNGNTASGLGSMAMGVSNAAGGTGSMAMGTNSAAGGSYSMAIGQNTTAGGQNSTAFGLHTTADSYLSTAIGKYNVGGGTAGMWVLTEPLFEIGIGGGSSAKANAVTVLKNGNVGIGDETPDYLLDMETDGVGGYYSASDHQWHNGSSRSLKQDIAPNEVDVMGILDDVEIVQYRFRTETAENPDAPYHVGFIAEDTPEMLSGKDRNSMSTGDCIGLLLAVVKEQQKEIEKLKTEMSELKR
jgi:hypothetical protein